jgi:CheY-like chemotaxis protein
MPNMDGEEAIHRMRRDPRLRGVPVVIVSAKDALLGAPELGTQLSINSCHPVSMEDGINRLKALLDILPSHDPLRSSTLEWSAGASLG